MLKGVGNLALCRALRRGLCRTLAKLLSWGVLFDKEKEIGVLSCIFPILTESWSERACVPVCVCTPKYTHTARGVFGCEFRCRNVGPEKSRLIRDSSAVRKS